MKRVLLVVLLLAANLTATPASESAGLKPFGRGSWKTLLQAHAGRPTLVYFWGVTCGPCKVELPQLGAFMTQNPAVDVVTIDADLVPNADQPALAMLRGAGLSAADNWVFTDGFAERLRYEIDPAWQGDIPRTLLIAPDGGIVTIEGVAELATLQEWSAKHVPAK
ncbi:TlpA family protein disulfide reductase [Rhodopseudomonas telluris]|uniref:TlpA family protein disulfide reductase n=1 Tax=Rhodopseudomonas telluris TaxID=644215 RepID=A0ABV6EPT9_9BRAD